MILLTNMELNYNIDYHCMHVHVRTSGWWYCVYMYLQVGGVGGIVCTFVHGMGCL